MIENGKRGVSADLVYLICDRFDIDARFFFGQIDSAEEADRRIHKPASPDSIMKKLSDIEKKVRPIDETDPVAQAIAKEPKRRKIASQIMDLNDEVLDQISSLIYGYLVGRQDQSKNRIEYEREPDARRA